MTSIVRRHRPWVPAAPSWRALLTLILVVSACAYVIPVERSMGRLTATKSNVSVLSSGTLLAPAAVVLAAGRSRRMAPHNKLLVTDKAGKPMIARVVDNVPSSKARPLLVVTGHQAEQVEHALGGRPVRYVHADQYADGLSASLKAGDRKSTRLNSSH